MLLLRAEPCAATPGRELELLRQRAPRRWRRRESLIEFLHELSTTDQVVVCTADPALIHTLHEIAPAGSAIVNLPSPADHIVGPREARVRVV